MVYYYVVVRGSIYIALAHCVDFLISQSGEFSWTYLLYGLCVMCMTARDHPLGESS